MDSYGKGGGGAESLSSPPLLHAREFIDNTGMPAIGKPFVSANKVGQSLRFRVVFSPDGKVQTFSESE